MAEHLLGIGKLVVDVDEEDEIERGGGEARVGFGAEDWLDIGEFGARDALTKQRDHAGLDVCGVDLSAGADGSGEELCVVAGAGADVGDSHAWAEVEEADRGAGPFLVFALGAFEPGGAADAHDTGIAASGDGVGIGRRSWYGQGERA